MATAVVMPKQGQSVESCIIVEWKKQPGEAVAEGDILCEVETDKAVLEVPSPASGTLLARFYEAGDDVPVLTTIAAVGEVGEDVSHLHPAGAGAPPPAEFSALAIGNVDDNAPSPASVTQAATTPGTRAGISPRARLLAQRRAVDTKNLQGSGPGGRIIERDVLAALASVTQVSPPMVSPVAKAMVDSGDFVLPEQGSGPRGRIMARDLAFPTSLRAPSALPGQSETTPIRGARKTIAERMLHSINSTAQLTLHSSADARALLNLRKRFKASDASFGLQSVTLNDLMLFAVARTLPRHPLLNATLDEDAITQYRDVNLGFAVDTPRGLLVPVIKQANHLSLGALASESKRLSTAVLESKITPDEMVGGTFTVTNLGSLGIEQFTPILNVPQVAILGVGSINLKPVAVGAGAETAESVQFIPHIGLSLTINHQVVDGAPAARFLHALALGIKELDLLLAL